MRYDYYQPRKKQKKRFPFIAIIVFLLLFTGGFLLLKKGLPEAPQIFASNKITYDASLSADEQTKIETAIKEQDKSIPKNVTAKASVTQELGEGSELLATYLLVTHPYNPKQQVMASELTSKTVHIDSSIDQAQYDSIQSALGMSTGTIVTATDIDVALKEDQTAIAILPADKLSQNHKLLNVNGNYYLDSFTKGALFRTVVFEGDTDRALSVLALSTPLTKDSVYKVNMTGVTAITRRMLRKYNEIKDPSYFGKNIASFLADADLTHVSNEVSFKAGCTYHNALFCAHPDTIQTLKDSGVDVVELTGNHNNDVGSDANTETINTYKSLGWGVFGGGLNTAEAAKPFTVDQKGTKIAFFGYNYPDSPNGGAIAGVNKAGANSFDFDRIKTDIETAKAAGQYVIVDIQFWECYAYPDGYVEFPECDGPITNQREVFRKVVDLGADMVVGSSAHQPQTYEIYNDSPIYYGLGNLYFEQIEWPGTERGIVLTHYFSAGKLIQTKLTPTEYDEKLQVGLMSDADAVKLLTRLDAAR